MRSLYDIIAITLILILFLIFTDFGSWFMDEGWVKVIKEMIFKI